MNDAKLLNLDLSPADLLPGYEGKLWEDHQAAAEAYLCVSTQWRVVGVSEGRLFAAGLDYQAVKVGLKLAGIKVTKQLWSELRMIEIGARRAMNGALQ